ncbi:hypothetical protein PVAP13_8NG205101 [Panicum virgatum]|uniref:Uncharacterized protein n=1 Tax=Panicum virgatum TaxID=38727 RepID=A0A8T0PB65_PANVG|nr:hypothetical protein PVAP13_8NG205101 [Panicum virgatum]
MAARGGGGGGTCAGEGAMDPAARGRSRPAPPAAAPASSPTPDPDGEDGATCAGASAGGGNAEGGGPAAGSGRGEEPKVTKSFTFQLMLGLLVFYGRDGSSCRDICHAWIRFKEEHDTLGDFDITVKKAVANAALKSCRSSLRNQNLVKIKRRKQSRLTESNNWNQEPSLNLIVNINPSLLNLLALSYHYSDKMCRPKVSGSFNSSPSLIISSECLLYSRLIDSWSGQFSHNANL